MAVENGGMTDGPLDHWVTRLGEYDPATDPDLQEAKPDPAGRPYGDRIHFVCGPCITAPPYEHDCTTCEVCLTAERQRSDRKDREAREVADGRYATEEHEPPGKGE